MCCKISLRLDTNSRGESIRLRLRLRLRKRRLSEPQLPYQFRNPHSHNPWYKKWGQVRGPEFDGKRMLSPCNDKGLREVVRTS
jgi:hypothetical protein